MGIKNLDLKSLILNNKEFKPYFKDILEWLAVQPLIVLVTDPEVNINFDRLIIKFKCLGTGGIYYEPFEFRIRETDETFIISNTLDTVIPSLFPYDYFTFPLIVQGEIKISKH